ncbi:MAG: NfeD family protein [Candidatus Fimenecus sp.]
MLTISSTALTVIWIVLLVLFLILEAATVQLVSAWFALGALCALLANLCGVGVVWQVVLFLVVSAICLIATRPLVKKMTATKIQKTNADRCIGAEAVVLEEINNLKSTGLVKAMGNTWTARSEDGSVIPKDAVVVVRKMEGVKLIVSQQSEKQ